MSLADALAEAAPVSKGPSCTVPRKLDALSADDRATLNQAIANRAAWTTIADALERVGVKIAPGTLSRHHRRRCECP